jgi:hypothetical protein
MNQLNWDRIIYSHLFRLVIGKSPSQRKIKQASQVLCECEVLADKDSPSVTAFHKAN